MGAGSYVQGGGDLVGMIGSLKGGQQASNAANQDNSALNSLLGTEGGAINQLIQSYFGKGGGAADISKLANWNGLKPGELGALQTTLGNNNQSMIRSLQTQMGGTANPGVLQGGMASSGQQNALNLGTQLGGMAQEQELGALTSAAGLSSGLLQSGLGDLSGMMNIYQQGAGNAMNTKGQDMGNLTGNTQNLAGLFSGGAAPGGAKGGPGGGSGPGPSGFNPGQPVF